MGNNFLSDIPGEHTLRIQVPAIAAGTDKKHGVLIVPFDCKVVDVKIVNQAAVTGNDTNYFTAKLLNGGADGSGTTVVASKAYTVGVDAVALTPEVLTNSVTAADLNLSKDEVLVYFSDQTGGSGLADPDKVIELTVTAR